MTKNKKKSKQKQRTRLLTIIITVVVCLCIVLGTMLYIKLSSNGVYKVEDRTKQIEKEKKKDDEGITTIAWLRVQGTNIDTPIVNYEDIDAIDNITKADFLWNEYSEESLQRRVNIQGHNILNLSSKPEIGLDYFTKFEELMSFVYTDFAKENQYIQYTIDGENYLYKIFAVYLEEIYNLDLYKTAPYTDEEVSEFIQDSLEKSIYKYDVEVKDTDDIITLITCTRMYGSDDKKQFVVVAKMINSNESTKLYELEETENYQEIIDLMEGADEDVEV